MEIENLHFNNLQNGEHLSFHNSFKELVEKYGSTQHGIEAAFAKFLPIFNDETEAFNPWRRSVFTKPIAFANVRRNKAFRCLADEVKAKLNHYDPIIVQIAKAVKVGFD